MENFQLYRTNLLLGGQLKWDIVIENSNNGLYVKDFHLSPISNNIPYTHQSDERLLNNSHQDNVMLYYKKIEGYFYNEGLNPEFNHNLPVIVKSGEYINPYSNIYDMGCKRMKNYKLYNKQFEFFCPVWIEQLTDSLMFNITIKGNNSEAILASRTLNISKSENRYTHDRFVKYFKNYIKDSELNPGTDNIATINLSGNSYITGLNAKTGSFVTKDISGVVNNMISRERPVIELDNMIISNFNNNALICKQLFNFNLCFNLDDIMSATTAKMLKGKCLTVLVDVFVDGKQLEKKSFNYEYDFIQKEKYYDDTVNLPIDTFEKLKRQQPELFTEFNVFEHLHDNECKDLITLNKYCPKICHWSLSGLPNYIFNLYRGFDGYGITVTENTTNRIKASIVENEHQYSNTPNTTISEYNISLNNIGWINYEEITAWNQFYKYMLNTEKNKTEHALYIGDSTFINGLKYKNIPVNPFYIMGLKVSTRIYNAIYNTYYSQLCELSKNLIVIIVDDLILLITTDWNKLTFAGLYDVLYNLPINAEHKLDLAIPEYIPYIENLTTLMKSVVLPNIVVFNGTINWKYTQGPSKEVKEVEYYKDDEIDYVFRYDGNIKPTFTDNISTIYYKDYLSDDRSNGLSALQKSIYAQYLYTGHEPVFPSINYSSCKKTKNYDWSNMGYINTSEYNNIPLIRDVEYSWFNSGSSIYLIPEINFKYINKRQSDNSYKDLSTIVRELLSEYYNASENVLDFIISKYDIKNDWEYFSETNVDDYIYSITLTMK